MVASFSPHRDAGGTLHFPTSAGIHAHTTAISELRRSLSRSPSKGADFRLLSSARFDSPSGRTTDFISSPLSPSKRPSQGNIFLLPNTTPQSPVAIPFPPSAKINRPTMRRSGMLPSSKSRIPSTSPTKRALIESRDHGNSGPIQVTEIFDTKIETPPSSQESKSSQGGVVYFPTAMETPESNTTSRLPSARIEKRRSGNFNSLTTASSPLKRCDASMNLDSSRSGSPSAKRRSMHIANFGSEFDIFEHGGNLTNRFPNDPCEKESRAQSPFSIIPKRSSSLRKSTLQQRQADRSLFPRPRSNGDPNVDSSPMRPMVLRNRQRMSLDNSIFPPTNRGYPPPHNASTFFMSQSTTPPSQAAAHPLSRTITQSSSTSSQADDSPTNKSPYPLPKEPKPILNFSKSLPVGSSRPLGPSHLRESSNTSDSHFATPKNYNLVKPLPAAFMSTGLISKKNRSATIHNTSTMSKNMPDTPCKRITNAHSTNSQLPRGTTLKDTPSQSFPAPSWTPLNRDQTTVTKGSGIFSKSRISHGRSRQGSIASIDDDGNPSQSPSTIHDSQSMGESDLPPTPTKQRSLQQNPTPFNFQSPIPTHNQIFPSEASTGILGLSSSPLNNKSYGTDTPRTPQEHILPPDPSGLSISAQNDHSSNLINPDLSTLPATPTAPREYFPQIGKRPSLVLGYSAPDVDQCLTTRFEKVELVGTGEFSLVYCVTERQPTSTPPFPSIFSVTTKKPSPLVTDKVWAVKKSKQPYTGAKDRQRRQDEVTVLKALANSDYIISFADSWEENNYLYIQTEFCEEGSLDVFLAQAGLKARLDDFRIWKILLELSHGLRHIHDSGFIHLDLKPANILITFEGVLKIADFGMATRWPAAGGIEGEGDREYIGPEILMGRYDKPADIFALGLIIFETAGNVELPDNGASWQKLRNGDMSDVSSLTWNCESSNILRDASGNPMPNSCSFESLCESEQGNDEQSPWSLSASNYSVGQGKHSTASRSGELAEPPNFMVDLNHDDALDKVVRWMISPDAADRPVAEDILRTYGVRWAERRRRAGATIYEGNWGPADEVLIEDAEMIDV